MSTYFYLDMQQRKWLPHFAMVLFMLNVNFLGSLSLPTGFQQGASFSSTLSTTGPTEGRPSISGSSKNSGATAVPGQSCPPGRLRKASSVVRYLNVFKQKKAMEEKRLETILFRKAIIITGVFSLLWSPYLIAVVVQLAIPFGQPLPTWFHTWAALGIYANSAMNPALYILLDTRWKRSALELLGLDKDISTSPGKR
jgi:hypothetical protein